MELIGILRVLRSRRLLVAIGLLCAIAIGVVVDFRVSLGLPPTLQSRQYKVGLASASVLIDTPTSAVADLSPVGAEVLTGRAQLLADLMATPPVQTLIARQAGVPLRQLITVGPAGAGIPPVPTSLSQQAAQLKPTNTYRLTIASEQTLPIIAVSTEAPDAPRAARLADSAVNALGQYLSSIASFQRIPPDKRPVVTSLGSAQAGEGVRGTRRIYGLVAGILAFGFFCSAIVLVSGVVRRWRGLEVEDTRLRLAPAARPNGAGEADSGADVVARESPQPREAVELASEAVPPIVFELLERARKP
jgi:hypothetical protein